MRVLRHPQQTGELLKSRLEAWRAYEPLFREVERIVEDVKRRGDEALVEYTRKFDGVDLTELGIRVPREKVEEAYEKVPDGFPEAVETLRDRVSQVASRMLENLKTEVELDGVSIKIEPKPVESAGCYVPGGRASYPSTAVMTSTPAKAAGVERVVACTPPGEGGSVNPATLVALDLCGVDEVYRVGGAQAVAAMAYGTETIKPVRVVVGPGNRYVTAAKMLVSRSVRVDLPAGPSELLVLADSSADPTLVALDLVSQAEHDVDAVCGLVTDSEDLAFRVVEEVERILGGCGRREVVSESLSKNGFVVVCGSMEEALEFVDEFAPEHLEVHVSNPEDLAGRVRSAGVVLVGPYAPTAFSDYYAGLNHVLPTGGYAHSYSGLSVLDFVRLVGFVESTPEALRESLKVVELLSKVEGLPNHLESVSGRFG